MKKGTLSFLFPVVILALAGPEPAPAADTVSIEPGLWDMNVRIDMPMLPQPQERNFTECIEQSELDPEDFNMDENSPCRISEITHSGQTVSWAISCPGPAGESHGQWSFTSKGDTLEGNGSMKMEMSGQSMEFRMFWTGARTGECEG